MSSIIPFTREFFRSAVNIQYCLTLERKSRLLSISSMEGRPWALALTRLLSERGLKKGGLSLFGVPRAGTISDVLNRPTPPDIRTLQQIAVALTRYDRRPKGGDPKAPDVELWEFFVTAEQAALLRTKASQERALTREDELAARLEQRLLERFSGIVREEIATAVEEPVKKKAGKK